MRVLRPHRVTLRFGVVAMLMGLTASGLAVGGAAASSKASTQQPKAQSGGTLKLIGQGDIDTDDTASGYYDVTFSLDRTFTRQLYTWPSATKFANEVKVVPDLATALPKLSNGGKTETITIRNGAQWDTTPPRQVTAADEVLGMKRLCNPASPSGAPGYFENTIVGMKTYCTGFAKVSPTSLSAINAYINGHNISGVKAISKTTVQFNLINPASDFVDILSMPFSTPVPVEYLKYLPGSPALGQHLLADGPYKITSYNPGHSITLARNPAWKASTDHVRKAYVNAIDVTEGVATNTAALEQLQAGTSDVLWDQNVPTASLAGMEARHDPDVVVGPDGNNFITINPYVSINLQSPNNSGALKKLKVRQALEYAFNKVAVSQVYGGSLISKPLNQVVPAGSVGNVAGFNPYSTPGDRGNAAKSLALLKQAGYAKGQVKLKLIYRTNTVHPQVAQTDQAALEAAGFGVQLIAVPQAQDFYTQYLENPTASKAGSWDIAEAGWVPDWMGNNGRAVIEPLFDGRTYGPNTVDFGDYNSPVVNNDIDKALSSVTTAAATKYWDAAAKKVMADAAVVPLGAQKIAVYHSSRVQNCLFNFFTENCDLTDVWLKS